LKKLPLLLLLLPLFCSSQDYVDLLRIGYGQTFNNEFEGTPNSTYVKSFDADLTVPVVINEKHAFITGAVYSRNNLQLFPEGDFTSLHSTIVKLGLASTYNTKWSSTLVFLPKVASDYVNSTSEDFYFGGLGLLKYQKNEHLKYRFGFYGSTEAFGFFTTPIIGWYYLSPNEKFEMDVSLPIAADVNYTFGITTVGFDYIGIGRSFRITENDADIYADVTELNFASYLQFNALEKSVLLRAKFGYSSSNYELYPNGETIDLGLSAFSFGDDREPLNPEINGGFYLKFEAIYRFDISEPTDTQPTIDETDY